MDPLNVHPVLPDGGPSSGSIPLVEPVRELRGFPLGTILLRLGLVGEGPINEALTEAERAGKPLGRFLVDRGVLDETQLVRALANQKGLPFVDAEHLVPDRRVLGLLSAHTANRLVALPLGLSGDVPVVVVADPTNQESIGEVAATIGGDAVIAVASPAKLREAIRAAYRPVEAPAPVISITPEPQAETESEPEPQPAPEPVAEGRATAVVAVTTAGRVELARCPSAAEANQRAQELASALTEGGWVSCGERLLRAAAVASLELVEL